MRNAFPTRTRESVRFALRIDFIVIKGQIIGKLSDNGGTENEARDFSMKGSTRSGMHDISTFDTEIGMTIDLSLIPRFYLEDTRESAIKSKLES